MNDLEKTKEQLLGKLGDLRRRLDVLEAAESERKRVEKQFARLNHWKEQLLGPGGLSDKLTLLTNGVVEVFDADFARIWVIKKSDLCEKDCRHALVAEGPHVCRDRTHCLHLLASSGRYPRIDGSHRRVPLGCYKIGRVASGEDLKFITNDVIHDPRVHDHQWAQSLGLVSFAGYRLVSPEGKPLGVFALFSQRTIEPAEEALLEDLANAASQAIRAGMTEEELKERETRLYAIVNGSIIPQFVIDKNHRILYWNKALEEYSGIKAEEVLGTNQHWRAFYDKQRPCLADLLVNEDINSIPHYYKGKCRKSKLLEEGYEALDFFPKMGKEGVWLYFTAVPIRDSHGQIMGALETLEDVTERKKAEEMLRKAHDELEQRVKDRTNELTQLVEKLHKEVQERTRAEKALQQERRTLEHLLRSSDHERQLIAYEIHDGLAQHLAGAIMQFHSYAHMKGAKPKQALKIYSAGMTMLNQAHAESRRLISGVRPPILDESGIVAAIAHLVNDYRRQKTPHIEFYSKVGFERLDSIVENTVYRIVQEGLANACKHSQSRKVRVKLLEHDRRLRIKVQDWGIGFDPDNFKENCFGLTGIRERARLLGGRVSIRTVLDKGTLIAVELPLVERK